MTLSKKLSLLTVLGLLAGSLHFAAAQTSYPATNNGSQAAQQPATTPEPTVTPTITATPSASPVVTGVSIMTTTNSLGEFLTDANGNSLYVFMADTQGVSNCNASNGCTSVWPPFTTAAGSTPQASGNAQAAMIGTIQRSDGTTQVTYNGMPLYTYVGDTSAGMTNGQGLNQFGGLWWLEQPNGTQLTGAAGASPTPASSPASTGTPTGY